VTLLILYWLASLDGLLCGCRTAMGRCPLIRLRPYYANSLVRGFVAVQIASAIAAMALAGVLFFTPHRNELVADLQGAARRMLWIFLPYASAVLAALSLRLLPSTDIRSASSVFFLGPLTAIRPLLMFVGVLFGVYAARFGETRLFGLLVVMLLLSIEATLNRLAGLHQSRQISSLL